MITHTSAWKFHTVTVTATVCLSVPNACIVQVNVVYLNVRPQPACAHTMAGSTKVLADRFCLWL